MNRMWLFLAALPSVGFAQLQAVDFSGSVAVVAETNRVVERQLGAMTERELFRGELGKVRAVSARGGSSAWISETPAGTRTLNVLGPQGLPVAIPLETTGKLGWVDQRPALFNGREVRIFNGLLQRLDPAEDLPEDAAYFPGPGDLVVAVRPYKIAKREAGETRTISMLTGYQKRASGWVNLGSYAASATGYSQLRVAERDGQDRIVKSQFLVRNPGFVFTEVGIAVTEEDQTIFIPFLKENWEPSSEPRVPQPGVTPIAELGGMRWGLQGASLRASSAQQPFAFVPWNRPGIPLGFGTQSGVLWVATTTGIQPLNPNRPDPLLGYGGFVRVPMMDQAPSTPLQSKLLAELETWIGTPYVWGGNDRNGVDCSGMVCQAFKQVGISVPRTSATLRSAKQGRVIRDELKIGDVLTYPGHVAVYVGNGNTIEAIKGGVGRSSIWHRTDVVVRRFLSDVK